MGELEDGADDGGDEGPKKSSYMCAASVDGRRLREVQVGLRLDERPHQYALSDSSYEELSEAVVAQMSGSSLKGGRSSCFAGFCSTSTMIESVGLPLNGTLMPRKLMVAPGQSSVREPRAAAKMSKLLLLTTRPRFLSLK